MTKSLSRQLFTLPANCTHKLKVSLLRTYVTAGGRIDALVKMYYFLSVNALLIGAALGYVRPSN